MHVYIYVCIYICPLAQYHEKAFKHTSINSTSSSQVVSPIYQASKSDLDLTQGDQSLLETLETLCGSANASSKFVDGCSKGSFVFLIMSL